jgi:hypothetical protein
MSATAARIPSHVLSSVSYATVCALLAIISTPYNLVPYTFAGKPCPALFLVTLNGRTKDNDTAALSSASLLEFAK